jgi:hypothetical protein
MTVSYSQLDSTFDFTRQLESCLLAFQEDTDLIHSQSTLSLSGLKKLEKISSEVIEIFKRVDTQHKAAKALNATISKHSCGDLEDDILPILGHIGKTFLNALSKKGAAYLCAAKFCKEHMMLMNEGLRILSLSKEQSEYPISPDFKAILSSIIKYGPSAKEESSSQVLSRGGAGEISKVFLGEKHLCFAKKIFFTSSSLNFLPFVFQSPRLLTPSFTIDGNLYFPLAESSLKRFFVKCSYNHAQSSQIANVLNQVSICALELQNMGLVHRDLKPDNLMFHNDLLKIIDLDLLVLEGSDDEESTKGTLFYISPECYKSKIGKHMHQRDMWAVGLIMYEAITGLINPFYSSEQRDLPVYSYIYALGNEASSMNQNFFDSAIDSISLEDFEGKYDASVESIDDFSTRIKLAMKGCLQKDPSKRLDARGMYRWFFANTLETSQKQALTMQKLFRGYKTRKLLKESQPSSSSSSCSFT